MKRTALLATLAAAALAGPAAAHTGLGTVHGFIAGAGHPLAGADHIIAMVAIGIWAFLLGGRALWCVPLAFVSFMVVGGALGAAGIGLPLVETAIAVSIAVLGALIAWNRPMPVALAAGLAATFALFHGHAHGAEMPIDGSGLAYGLGFVAATALLHAAGLLSAAGGAHAMRVPAVRAAGLAIATAGLALLA